MLGRYRVESLVGRGGMGAVYLATDTQLDRRVALKVLSPELSDDEHFRKRFIAESRTAASLDHPNIVPVYEAGEIDGRLFIAMRYIDGKDLSDVLAERGALPIALAVRILAAIAAALDAAHGKGLVHRDVKPGNVLLTGSDDAPLVYLTDFGLTKRVGDQSLTAAGQIVGSIGYVAPEQVEGRPVDQRTDIYSLGCLAFEMLAGAPPFRRDSEMATLMAHVQDPPPSLLTLRHELPEALDAAVAQAMAKDPAARFAAAGKFAAAVSEAVRPDSAAITRGFLFADLRGYTAYVESHGDAVASELLDVYRRMMRDTIARHGGAEIKTEGDSFYVVFPSASSAVICGLSIVAAAAGQSVSDPDHPIQVGVGVNAGEAVAAAEGYVGSAVNIAARVCALAKAGEVLVTDTVRGLTRTSGRLTFSPVGRRTLKGIAEPMLLFRAQASASLLAATTGGRGPIWRRPRVAVGAGGLLVVSVLLAVALRAGVAPGGRSTSPQPHDSGGVGRATPRATIQVLPPGSDVQVLPPGSDVEQPHALSAGPYVNDRFDPAFSVQFGDGWFLHNSYVDAIGFIRNEDENQAIDIVHIQVVWPTACPFDRCGTPSTTALVGRTSDDVVRWVQSHPNLAVGDPQPVNVAGISGLTIDADVVRGAGKASFCAAGDDPNGDYLYLFPVGGYGVGQGDVLSVLKGSKLRLMILEVSGRATTIIIRAPSNKFVSFAAKAGDVIHSLQLR